MKIMKLRTFTTASRPAFAAALRLHGATVRPNGILCNTPFLPHIA